MLFPAGFEARGFIFAAPLALALKCAFVPFRKPGKLPGMSLSQSTATPCPNYPGLSARYLLTLDLLHMASSLE